MDFAQFLLSDTSQMAQLIRTHPWGTTPLGPYAQWPQSLKTAVGIMLTTRHPVCIAWGLELICLYNDGFAALLGPEKHPYILGLTAAEAWPESHAMVAIEIDRVMNGGAATWYEDRHIPMLRHGQIEDAYWTYSRGPIPDATAPNGVGGVLTLITETTSTVERRKASEACLELTLQAGRMAVWDADLRTGTIKPSPALNRLFDYSEESKLSLEDIRSRYHPSDRDKILSVIEATRHLTERFVEVEYRYLRTDASVRWLLARVQIDFDTQAQPVRSFGVLMDVTDRKQAEQHLALEYEVTRIISITHDIQDTRNSILALLCEQMDAACAEWWETRGDQPELTCRAFSERQNGMEPFAKLTWSTTLSNGEGLPGRVLESRAPIWIDDVQIDPNFPRAAAATAVGLRSAIGFPLFNGNICIGTIAFFSTIPIARDNSKLDLFAALGRKIGSLVRQSRAEDASRLNQVLKQSILDVSLDAIIAADEQGIVVEWNAAATKVFGYRSEVALGSNLVELIIPMDLRQRHLDGMARYLSTGYGPVIGKRVELDALRADGTRFPVELAINPIHIEGKTFFTAFVRDIRERKRSDDSIRLLMREVNHRSKNLLAVVQAIARQSAQHDDPKLFANKFQQRLQGLAASHDLLVHNSWQGIDLRDLITSQLSHLDDLVGIRIHLTGPYLQINATAAQSFGMALHELSTNAVKYGALSNSDGSVEISWKLDIEATPAMFHMTWKETGGPLIHPPAQNGFGTRLLSDMVATTTQGWVNLDYPASGLYWSLKCPVAGIVNSAAGS